VELFDQKKTGETSSITPQLLRGTQMQNQMLLYAWEKVAATFISFTQSLPKAVGRSMLSIKTETEKQIIDSTN